MRGRSDHARKLSLQNKLHFQTYDQTTCKPKLSNTQAATSYDFMPSFESGIYTPNKEIKGNAMKTPRVGEKRSIKAHIEKSENSIMS